MLECTVCVNMYLSQPLLLLRFFKKQLEISHTCDAAISNYHCDGTSSALLELMFTCVSEGSSVVIKDSSAQRTFVAYLFPLAYTGCAKDMITC